MLIQVRNNINVKVNSLTRQQTLLYRALLEQLTISQLIRKFPAFTKPVFISGSHFSLLLYIYDPL
jgi:hypothetical protein